MTKKIYAIDIIHTKNIRSRWKIPLVINKIKRQSLPDYKWCQHTIQRRNEKDSGKGSPSLPIKKRTRSKIFHTSINFIRMTVTKAEADSSICAMAKKKKLRGQFARIHYKWKQLSAWTILRVVNLKKYLCIYDQHTKMFTVAKYMKPLKCQSVD